MSSCTKFLAVAVGVIAALTGYTEGAKAEQDTSLLGNRTASVTYGPYARVEFGGSLMQTDDAYWLPPGSADPRISFDASSQDTFLGAVALGYDWQNGIRADLSFFGTGTSDVSAPCSGASNGTPCSDHAEVTDASVSTRGAMGNVFYAPLEARGSNSVFQPFIVAGVGIATNEMGDWTRENPASPRPVRTFSGGMTSNLAWSVGIGASLQVTRPGRWPVIVEAAWRYYDFGSATGGSTPLTGSGTSEPRRPFSFDLTSQVISLGVRIPLERY